MLSSHILITLAPVMKVCYQHFLNFHLCGSKYSNCIYKYCISLYFRRTVTFLNTEQNNKEMDGVAAAVAMDICMMYLSWKLDTIGIHCNWPELKMAVAAVFAKEANNELFTAAFQTHKRWPIVRDFRSSCILNVNYYTIHFVATSGTLVFYFWKPHSSINV